MNGKEVGGVAGHGELERAGRVRLIDGGQAPYEHVLVLFVLVVAVDLLGDRRGHI